MSSILDFIEKIIDLTGRIVSYLLIITVLATVIEVIARYGFNSPTIWAYEVEMFTCAILYALIGAYVLLHKGHVSVDLFYRRLSDREKIIINLVVFYPLILIMAGGLIYMGAGYAWASIIIGEKSYSSWGPPIWPVKLMLPIGSALIFLQATVDFIRNLSKLRGGLR